MRLEILCIAAIVTGCAGGGSVETNQNGVDETSVITNDQGLAARTNFLNLDYEWDDIRGLSEAAIERPTQKATFVGHVYTELPQQSEDEYRMASQGDIDLVIDFEAPSAPITGHANQFVIFEYDNSGSFLTKDVEFTHYNILYHTDGTLDVSGDFDDKNELRLYGDLSLSAPDIETFRVTVESNSYVPPELGVDSSQNILYNAWLKTQFISENPDFSTESLTSHIIAQKQ